MPNHTLQILRLLRFAGLMRRELTVATENVERVIPFDDSNRKL